MRARSRGGGLALGRRGVLATPAGEGEHQGDDDDGGHGDQGDDDRGPR
jgi:hypothetical protein